MNHICEYCKKEFEFILGSGFNRYCSNYCKSYWKRNRKLSKNHKEKIRKSLLGRKLTIERRKNISNSKKGKPVSEEQKKNLSLKLKGRKRSEEIRKKFSLAQQLSVKLGKHKGWKARKNKEPSYAENFFIKVLENNQINFIREYKINRFFADFAFLEKKLVLEIDGKQHLLPKRALSDKIKDEILKKEGWKVYRIKWKNPINEENSNYIRKEIINFLKWWKLYS